MNRRHRVCTASHYRGPRLDDAWTVWCTEGDLELKDLTREQAESWAERHRREHPQEGRRMSAPDEAIKAAADAIRDSLDGDQQRADGFAREVLEVAAPRLREAIAQEIEAAKATQRVATDHEPRWSAGACKCGTPIGDGIDMHWHTVNQALEHAAGVARGGGEA